MKSPRRSRGCALDQMRLQDDVARRAVALVAETTAEQVDGRFAERVGRLVHSRQRRLEEAAEEDVVDADDRDVARHRQAEVAHRGAGAEGVHVVEGDVTGRSF